MTKRHAPIDGYWPPTSHPNYAVWYGMKGRCRNINHSGYHKYGGVGISYCESWESFENFCKDMGVRPSLQHSIDRIDPSGDYHPENCRWATKTQQCLNRRVFSNNTTGVTGVYEISKGKFRAYFDVHGKRHNAPGVFRSIEDARSARQSLVNRFGI